MPGLLKVVAVTDVQRRAHDTHRPLVVAAVLGVLLLHLYLFTTAPRELGIPGPGRLAERFGFPLGAEEEHDLPEWTQPDDGPVWWYEPFLIPQFEPGAESTDAEWDLYQRRVLGFQLTVFGAFLCAYFLPLPLKQPSLAFWTLVGVVVMYGVRAATGLLFAHSIVYLVFHPSRRWPHALLPGLMGGFAFGPEPLWARIATCGAAALLGAVVYRYGLLRLLVFPKVAAVVRTVVAQSAMITIVTGALLQGFTGQVTFLSLGILLFFWQALRTILYQIDYNDGFVPKDLSLGGYLGVFLTPGTGAYWDWFNVIGQGYSYANNSFLCEDKNRIVLGGVRILLLAALYLAFWRWGEHLMVALGRALDVPVYGTDSFELVERFTHGEDVSTASVLLTTLTNFFRWLLIVGGLVHYKVGLWRICGYRIDSFFDRPWMATNLVSFWSRYTYHYREFLVRAFYYPVLLRFFKKRPALRVVAATLAAAAIGNMIWGHFTEDFDQGLRLATLVGVLKTWPYFLLLGLGISAAELYQMRRRKTRRPWTPGPRIVLDLLAAYATIQFYSLITLFRRGAPDTTTWDLVRLFLRGFGVHL